MKIQLFLVASAISSIHGLDQACHNDRYCANDVVNTEPTIDSSIICPDLAATTLMSFTYLNDDGTEDVLIELRGPSDMADAADLVITAPHGGDLKPDYIDDRATSGTYCPSGCKTAKDSYTKEVSELLQQKFITNYCKVPFLVINHLHRSKLDANREIDEAAQGNAVAEEAWEKFHTLIHFSQINLRDHFGTSTVTSSTGSSKTGVHALMFDMHGYAGTDWHEDGSPLIQWGYRISDNSLEHCPLDSRSAYSIGTLTHARWMDGHSYECLVRGPGSLASRVSDLLNESGGLTSNALCGHGTPSNEYPSPQTLANDPIYCEDMNDANPDECHYYSGGYDIKVHERMNWQDGDGDHFNAVQAELPRCIRFGESSVHESFADKLSVAVMSFLRDLYGAMP
mmetsp:Transcript_24169/g.52129  ORF Transcript_24169/g.52129 Transcript_24169/m.52129 type:complete len:397 (-) Transcript_24169:100-1290(-)